MKLIDDWWHVLKHAWSVRMALIAAALGGAEMALPAFMESLPHGTFLALSMFVCVGAAFSRLVEQPKMNRGPDS